jgi:hypothetical protein
MTALYLFFARNTLVLSKSSVSILALEITGFKARTTPWLFQNIAQKIANCVLFLKTIAELSGGHKL